MDPVPTPRASPLAASTPQTAPARTTPARRPSWVLLIALAWLVLGVAACAERDNPFDPANRVVKGWEQFTPVAGPKNYVVDPSSPAHPPYQLQDLKAAFDSLQSGDTLWIRGPRDYLLENPIQLTRRRGTASSLPIVVRPYGGEVRFSNRTQNGRALFDIQGEDGNISFEHLIFGPSPGDGVVMWGVVNPVRFRDCTFEKNRGFGLYADPPQPRQDPMNPSESLPLPISIILEQVRFLDNGRGVRQTIPGNKSQLAVPAHILDSTGVTFTFE